MRVLGMLGDELEEEVVTLERKARDGVLHSMHCSARTTMSSDFMNSSTPTASMQ